MWDSVASQLTLSICVCSSDDQPTGLHWWLKARPEHGMLHGSTCLGLGSTQAGTFRFLVSHIKRTGFNNFAIFMARIKNFVLYCLGPYSTGLKTWSWLFAQGSFLVVLTGPHRAGIPLFLYYFFSSNNFF